MKDINKKSEEALRGLLDEKRKGLYDFRVALSGGKARKSMEARILRRDLARILTVMGERGRGITQ